MEVVVAEDEQDFTPDLEPDEGDDYIEPSDGTSQGKGDQNVGEDEGGLPEDENLLPDEEVEV